MLITIGFLKKKIHFVIRIFVLADMERNDFVKNNKKTSYTILPAIKIS